MSLIDWGAIERHYRAGVRTLADIGAEFGCTKQAISQKAKQAGWERSLAHQIKVAAEEKIAELAMPEPPKIRSEVTDKAIIEANADLQSKVIQAHRRDITKARSVVRGMLDELSIMAKPEVRKALYALVKGEGTQVQLEKALEASLTMPNRATTSSKLTQALATLIEKERQAFGIDKDATPEQGINKFLASLPD